MPASIYYYPDMLFVCLGVGVSLLLLQGMRCKESTFELLNSCQILTENFPCSMCSESYGTEQPCYVEPHAPALNVSETIFFFLRIM